MNGENSAVGQHQSFSPFKFVFLGIAFLVLLNMAYVNWLLFLSPKQDAVLDITPFDSSVSPVIQEMQEEIGVCPQSCISQIQEATASYKLAVTTPAISPAETKASAQVKEFFVPLGSGSGRASDWEDIEGLQVYIDGTNFEGIKKVTFEVSVRIPTGNQTAYVRLFNKTDKHPIWLSEVSITGGTPQLLISDPIALDKGNKLYQVQIKTQLQFLTVIDQARIHIITQ